MTPTEARAEAAAFYGQVASCYSPLGTVTDAALAAADSRRLRAAILDGAGVSDLMDLYGMTRSEARRAYAESVNTRARWQGLDAA